MRAERWHEALWGWFTHLHIRLAYRLIWLGARLGHGTSRSVYQAMWDVYLDLPPLRSDRLQPARPLTPLGEALQGFGDDYMTSEEHHPGYVLIPTEQFERIRSTLESFHAQ